MVLFFSRAIKDLHVPAYLRIRSEGHGDRVECKDIITLGRDGTNSLPIKDPEMSRNHAMVRRIGQDQYYLFDTGSRNGSFVNGLRISSPTLLKSGDIVSLGNTSVVFEQVVVPRAGARPPATESMAETMRSDFTSIKKITVLVADIRGYTTMSEQLPIKLLSDIMSEWFDGVGKIVERNGGRVDKFIGDCVMVIWDLVDDPRPQAQKSVQTAYEIYGYTAGLNKRFPDLPTVMRVGVGINTGEAAVGIGVDNTAMGDTVNLAFRLEAASKTLNCDLVLSKSTYELLPTSLWQGREKEIQVKGKKDAVRICTLMLSQKAAAS